MDLLYNEQQTIGRCTAGDRKAQRALFEAHCDALLSLCRRYLPREEEAREAMMDGFYQGFRRLESFEYRGPGSLSAWLRRIMVNQCLMRLRKPAPEEDLLHEELDLAAEGELLATLSAKEILLLIHRLPDGYRAVFNLYFFEDLTHREIAEQLGISVNTSKSQLFKARASLQQSINERYKHS